MQTPQHYISDNMSKENEKDCLRMSIAAFRKAGYKIRIRHFRRFAFSNGEQLVVMPFSRKDKIKDIPEGFSLLLKGGFTYVETTAPNGITKRAYAYCNNQDSFNYKVGSHLALYRTLEKLK